MSFLTPEFWIFLSAFLVIYFRFSLRGQNRLLILANLFYLGSWGWPSLLIHIFASSISYYWLKQVEKLRAQDAKRKIYFYSYIGIMLTLFALVKVLVKSSSPSHISHYGAVGLSFYSLQLVGTFLEVYWRRSSAPINFSEHFLMNSFFPILLMGPIERKEHLMPQFEVRRTFCHLQFVDAIYLISLGLLKKLAVANVLAKLFYSQEPSVNSIYGFGLILYCILGFMMVYADFSGFVDIARGVAKLLGIDLLKNFNQPYFAKNVVEVWQRWHITFTTWLRDYIYFPILLATRKPFLAGAAVFFLAAAWHDISFAFLLWALYWLCLFQAYVFWSRLNRDYLKLPNTKPLKILAQVITLLFVSLSSLVFAVHETNRIPELLMRLFNWDFLSFSSVMANKILSPIELAYASVCFILVMASESIYSFWSNLENASAPDRVLKVLCLATMLIFFTAAFASSNHYAFIYLRY